MMRSYLGERKCSTISSTMARYNVAACLAPITAANLVLVAPAFGRRTKRRTTFAGTATSSRRHRARPSRKASGTLARSVETVVAFQAPTFHIHTLGCRVNQYDEELLRRELGMRGFREVAFDERADVYIINTCTVTHVADKKSRQLIRRALRANPQASVIATGCAVSNKKALGLSVSEHVLQVSNKHKERLIDLVRAHLPPHHERDERAAATTRQARARSLLKVQDGCDQFCTFCIVPFVRGRARSKSPHEILAEARGFVAAGSREIVVTGTHVGCYGRDLTPAWHLGRLMRLLAEESGAPRIRLSSIEPADFPMDMLETMRESSVICPHLHLALQHASDRVLSRMRRGYTLAQYDAIVAAYLARFPDGALAADVLVGFPGEDDEDFALLEDYLASRPFAHLHVFPYSVRPGTAAARMPARVSDDVMRGRMDRILALANDSARAFRSRFVGRTVRVIVEEEVAGRFAGTADNSLSVQFDATRPQIGTIVDVQIQSVTQDGVQGRLVSTS